MPERLIRTVPYPPANELVLDTGNQFTPAWARYFQRLSDWLSTLSPTEAGGEGGGAGDIGDYLDAETDDPVALTTSVETSVLTLDLDAGDWDVTGQIGFTVDAGTSVDIFAFGINDLDTTIMGGFSSAAVIGAWAGTKRIDATDAVTVSLQVNAVFTGTMSAHAQLHARRMR